MRLEASLDRLHHRATGNPYLRLFAALIRALLAAGFIIPGVIKLEGRFTRLPLSTPVGFFLEAFYRAHSFYLFVGLAQIAAAVLLLFPLTTTLGAVLYFPIILCIFVINIAVGFTGTYFVTALMTLGALYLLCWDYDRWKGILPGFGAGAGWDASRHVGVLGTFALGAIGGLAGLDAAQVARAIVEGTSLVRPVVFLVAAGVFAGTSLAWYRRRLRRAAPAPGLNEAVRTASS